MRKKGCPGFAGKAVNVSFWFFAMSVLNADKSRPMEGGPSFTLGNRVVRVVWRIVWLAMAAWTPPQFRGWRRFLLRIFGARIAKTADIYGSARIWLPSNLEMGEFSNLGPRADCYCMAQITFGPRATVSQGAYLCAGTHDVDDPNMQLMAKPIILGENCWIAADAFVGPGVTVGDGAVLGARAVTFRDLEPNMIYVGNPAQPTRPRRAAR
jgi:putative colanic acid biosynthesis acetyltransferase WcaF